MNQTELNKSLLQTAIRDLKNTYIQDVENVELFVNHYEEKMIIEVTFNEIDDLAKTKLKGIEVDSHD